MKATPLRWGAMAEAGRELIARAKRGDRAARERLARRHRREVFRVAYAILGDDEEAEDATQEALVRMLRGLAGFDERRDLGAWVRRIAVNCALNAMRRRPDEAEAPGEQTAASNTADEAQTHDLQRAVRRALAELPERQRVAMSLFALEEMDLRSTAEAMGCAEGTVKSHLHRARQRVREILSDWLED
ncbi:MAG: sigma-70 family RNA polymerase sigma factor [Armatimonadota bacterium]|nr:sigma-70 family RNA polymerase sigma factor [Armatimonadota bacterium]